jgi:hypothetical protein
LTIYSPSSIEAHVLSKPLSFHDGTSESLAASRASKFSDSVSDGSVWIETDDLANYRQFQLLGLTVVFSNEAGVGGDK